MLAPRGDERRNDVQDKVIRPGGAEGGQAAVVGWWILNNSSALGARRSALGARRSALGARRSALLIVTSPTASNHRAQIDPIAAPLPARVL